jgi:hypothetical protein
VTSRLALAAAVLALLVMAPSAVAASAVIDTNVSGAGTVRIETDVPGPNGVVQAITCGAHNSPRSDLSVPTGKVVQACKYNLTAAGCPGGAATCELFLTARARPPGGGDVAPSETDWWKVDGWSEGPCAGQKVPTCSFAWARCTASTCDFLNNRITAAFVDVHTPEARFVAKPETLVQSPTGTAVFVLRSDEYSTGEYSRFECQLDSGAWGPCQPAPPPAAPGAHVVTGVSEGSHVLKVRAIDPSGRTQNDGIQSATWTQRYPPVVTIPSPAEGARISTGKPSISFVAGADSTFECRLGDGAWSACASPYVPTPALGDGPHTFAVRATRDTPEGDVLGEVVERHFTVDTAPPVAKLVGGPVDGLRTNDRSATFTFTIEPPEDVAFECRLDSEPFSPCSEGIRSYALLPSGVRTFSVRAIDRAGNVQQTPTTVRWTVTADGDGDLFHGPDNDCDDTDPGRFPGNREVQGDGIDQDCDGVDPPNLDRDGDGFTAAPAGRDCDDGDARRAPGNREIPENGVDDDCDGEDPTFPLIDVDFTTAWLPGPRATEVRSIKLRRAPRDALVRIRCGGRSCEKPLVRLRVRRATRNLELRRYVPRRLRSGTVLEIRVLKAQTTSQAAKWVIRRGKAPRRTDWCYPRGTKQAC